MHLRMSSSAKAWPTRSTSGALRCRVVRGLEGDDPEAGELAGIGCRRFRRTDAEDIRGACPPIRPAENGAIYYGLGVTEHSQGSTMVMGMANLAMATGNIGRTGVGVNPLRGQNNVQGSCDMGSFPHELPGYRHGIRR